MYCYCVAMLALAARSFFKSCLMRLTKPMRSRKRFSSSFFLMVQVFSLQAALASAGHCWQCNCSSRNCSSSAGENFVITSYNWLSLRWLYADIYPLSCNCWHSDSASFRSLHVPTKRKWFPFPSLITSFLSRSVKFITSLSHTVCTREYIKLSTGNGIKLFHIFIYRFWPLFKFSRSFSAVGMQPMP